MDVGAASTGESRGEPGSGDAVDPVVIYNAALDAELEKYAVVDESADGDDIIAREIRGNVLVTDAEDEPADEEAGTGALSQFDEDEANVYYRDDDGNVFAVGKDRDMGREGYYPADFDSEEE